MKTLLTNLIYTRISHDLSNVAGAIYNGTELLTEDPGFVQDTSVLIQNSSKILIDRLKFFRQAFGTPGSMGEDATSAYLTSLSTPIQLTGVCVEPLCKVLAMVMGDCLIRGGQIRLTEEGLSGSGPHIKIPEGMKDVLENGTLTSQASLAPALYAYFLAKEQNLKLMMENDEKSVIIHLKGVVNSRKI